MTVGAIGVIVLALVVWRWKTAAETLARSVSVSAGASGSVSVSVSLGSSERAAADARAEIDAATPPHFVSSKWGSGRGELGRMRPQEGNAEGPMSVAAAGREIVVLDQVNRRLVRYDRNGLAHAAGDAPDTAQDIAVASNGTVAMLDRLSGKNVTLVDERGRTIGQLPLPSRVGDTGLLTGVFVDGSTVYVEREHGTLVPIGTTGGDPVDEAASLMGRPSRDGTLLLTALISSSSAGQVTLNAFDRGKGASRFARVYQFAKPTTAIVLLDTDARGTIYLGVAAGGAGEGQIACIDPRSGQALGRVAVALSTTPEESFRDFAVQDDGTIVYAVRSEEGVDYRVARCP
jgi:hypothetical protein